MADLDSALRNIAKKVLDTFGTSITYRRILVGDYSTTTGAPVKTEIDKTIKGRLDEYKQHEIGDTVEVGDRKLTIAASDLSYEPSSEDQVLIGTNLYRIVSVKSPQATDDAAMHVCQIRGAK
jgi:hypothetical protein